MMKVLKGANAVSVGMCLRYLCLEVLENAAVVLRKVQDDGEPLRIEVRDLDEALEVLEELTDIAFTVAQYIKEVRYLKTG